MDCWPLEILEGNFSQKLFKSLGFHIEVASTFAIDVRLKTASGSSGRVKARRAPVNLLALI